MNNRKQFLSRRAQMAFVGMGLWLLLAAWSLSAFWSHIDSLGESYHFAAKCGAMAGEFALLALVLWHCFDRHLGVRRWSLILGFVLAAVILVHAGAMRGMNEARAARIETEDRLAKQLTAMSKEQAAAVGSTGAGLVAAGQTRQDRAAIAGKTAASQTEIARNAQQALAAEVSKTDEAVKAASILPDWYLNGWCYSLLFILSLAFVGVIFALMMNGDDVDEDYNGVPDRLERQPAPVAYPVSSPAPIASTASQLTAEDAPKAGSFSPGHWSEFEQTADDSRRRRWVPAGPEAKGDGLDRSASDKASQGNGAKPRAVWRGGVQVDPREDSRGN